MAIISGIAKGITVTSDLVNAVDSLNKLWNAQDDMDKTLHTASTVNRLILLGFTCAELGCLISGADEEKILLLKRIEILPRTLNVPIQLVNEVAHAEGGFKGTMKIITKGFLAPAADLLRVGAESGYYQEKVYLKEHEKSPEDAQRPIYDNPMDPEDPPQIIGYRKIDPKECQENMADFQQLASGAAVTQLCANTNVPELLADGTVHVYEMILRLFQQEAQDGQAPAEGVNLLNFPVIPAPLRGDVVFRQHICPITQEPIRDPVRDPSNHLTVYERAAIVNWLQVDPQHRSPITQQAINIADLEEMPALRLIIDNRLRHHQAALENFLQGQAANA